MRLHNSGFGDTPFERNLSSLFRYLLQIEQSWRNSLCPHLLSAPVDEQHLTSSFATWTDFLYWKHLRGVSEQGHSIVICIRICFWNFIH